MCCASREVIRSSRGRRLSMTAPARSGSASTQDPRGASLVLSFEKCRKEVVRRVAHAQSPGICLLAS